MQRLRHLLPTSTQPGVQGNRTTEPELDLDKATQLKILSLTSSVPFDRVLAQLPLLVDELCAIAAQSLQTSHSLAILRSSLMSSLDHLRCDSPQLLLPL
jgi:hypothetical protein